MRVRASDECDLDSGLLERSEIRPRDAAVGDDLMQRRGRSDQGKAAASEFAGVADDDRVFCNFDHHTVDLGFQKVGRAEAEMDVEAIHT